MAVVCRPGIVTAVDAAGGAPIAKSPVFADVDTGVDDAMALVYLLASADAELVGIASTGGNVAVQQVCENNLGLLELCQAPGIPVSKGADQPLRCPMCSPGKAHGPRGLGYADLPPERSSAYHLRRCDGLDTGGAQLAR